MLKANRQCGSCTSCCDGTLAGEVYGTKFFGTACHFCTETGCAIYNNRPEKQCKDFDCEWLRDTTFVFPEFLKPSRCGFVMVKRSTKDKQPYIVAATGEKQIDAKAVLWLCEWANKKNVNLIFKGSVGTFIFGSDKFKEQIK